jgi:hypothetical protein
LCSPLLGGPLAITAPVVAVPFLLQGLDVSHGVLVASLSGLPPLRFKDGEAGLSEAREL